MSYHELDLMRETEVAFTAPPRFMNIFHYISLTRKIELLTNNSMVESDLENGVSDFLDMERCFHSLLLRDVQLPPFSSGVCHLFAPVLDSVGYLCAACSLPLIYGVCNCNFYCSGNFFTVCATAWHLLVMWLNKRHLFSLRASLFSVSK